MCTSSTMSLYGISTTDCREKIINTLLPMSYGIYTKCEIPLYKKSGTSQLSDCFGIDSQFETEKVHSCPQFINGPPSDVCVSRGEHKDYYESKVVIFKESKTELILRQDCYGFNCIQNILLNNSQKSYNDITSLLSDDSITETPYLWMLMWNSETCLDCVVFTDVSIMKMIYDAKTPRSRKALEIINGALSEFSLKNTMTYKEAKNDTVAHQKVSLFPFRDRPYTPEFRVKSTDVILEDVRPDINFWYEVRIKRLSALKA